MYDAGVELRVPARDSYTSLIAALVSDAATRAQLGDDERGRVVEATSLAFRIVVAQAHLSERDPVHVHARCTPAELCISLRERGLPIDDTAVSSDPRWREILDRVDRAHWKLRGRSGTELQMAVQRPHHSALRVQAPPAAETVPPAPEQSYTIRRFEAVDAPGVARAFFLTWGYRYILPAVYVPERLAELNRSNAYISMVASAENGEIVGHYALEPVSGAPIADACAAIVVPAHRGRGLLERLRQAAEDEAKRLGFAGYYSEPVTTHGRTQSESAKFDAHLCALVLGADPRSFVPKHMDVSGAGQRQSFTVYFKALRGREARVLYAPEHHREVIAKIYESLGLPIEFATGEGPAGSGELHVHVNRQEGFAVIDISDPGPHTGEQLVQAVSDLRNIARVGAMYVNLPLEHPATPMLCEGLERVGFFFSGVIPWLLGGRDALRMQLPLTRIDLSGVTVIGDFGEQLKSYIGEQMAAQVTA